MKKVFKRLFLGLAIFLVVAVSLVFIYEDEITEFNRNLTIRYRGYAVIDEHFEYNPDELDEPVEGKAPRYDDARLKVYGVDTDHEVLEDVNAVEFKVASFQFYSDLQGGAPGSEDRTEPCGISLRRIDNIHGDMYIRDDMHMGAVNAMANPEKEILWSLGDYAPKFEYYYNNTVDRHNYYLEWINHWDKESEEIIIYNDSDNIRQHIYDIKLDPEFPEDLFNDPEKYRFEK